MQILFTRKVLLLSLIAGVFAQAATVSRVTSFSDGEVLFAADLESEFNNLVDNINALDNDNLASGANISASKISATIAGDGIARNGSTGVLEVNDDNSTLEISGDILQVKDAGITLAKQANLSALSVIGNGTNLSAAPSALAAGTDGHVLRRSGTAVAFGTVATDGIADSAVTTAKILDGTIANGDIADTTIQFGKLADRSVSSSVSAGGVAISTSDSGSFSTTSTSFASVTNLTVTITTTGRPVKLMMISGSVNNSNNPIGLYVKDSCSISAATTGTCIGLGATRFARDGSGLNIQTFGHSFRTTLSSAILTVFSNETTSAPSYIHSAAPCSAFSDIDNPSAGTYTYTTQASLESTLGTVYVKDCKLVAFEL